jgi:acyl-CoA synthetase (AMP-forming)/AMP-acid ligase II
MSFVDPPFATAFAAFADTAARYPKNDFLCTPNGTHSYGAALARIEELRKLFERSGIGHGHRVALLLGNRPEYFFCLFALNALGAWAVPVNPESTASEIEYQLTHSEADLGIVSASRLGDFSAIAKMPVFAIENLPNIFPSPKKKPLAGSPNRETVGAVLYTSGTTGKPKGCLIANEYFLTSGAWYLGRGGHMSMDFGVERIFNPFPVHHMNAGVVSVMAMTLSASCLVQWDRFHPKSWWRDIVATGSTAVHYMGLIPPVLARQEPVPEERQHKVKFGFGAGVDPDIHVEFEKRFGFPLIECWGMTEAGRIITDDTEPRRVTTRSFGRVRDGLEVIIADDDDKQVPDGTPGNFLIRLKGPNPRKGFFSGYLNDEKATEDAWRGGWLHTGDICMRDADGTHYFVDRKKNITRRSGENIAAAEVEAAVAAHPAVHTVAALPIADDLRDEEVMVCVVLVPGAKPDRATAASIFSACYERLAYFKTPGWIVFRDTLPTTSTSKIQKSLIFGANEEPTATPRSFDFRSEKRRPVGLTA